MHLPSFRFTVLIPGPLPLPDLSSMRSRPSTAGPSRREWGVILAFWGTFALLSIGQDAVGDGAVVFRWGKAAGELVEYGTWALFTPLPAPPNRRVPGYRRASPPRLPAPQRPPARRHEFFRRNPDRPQRRARGARGRRRAQHDAPFLQQVQEFWFLDELMVYVVVLMAGFARVYYLQKREREAEAERLEARTEALEAQLTEARLSELLRHVLDEDAPQEVPLSEELDFLDDYLDIQTIRFQGNLDTTIDVPPPLHDARVPNLLLQPVVENAIRHGTSQIRGTGRIVIRGRRDYDRLMLTVQDNGPGMSAEPTDGLGLRNVRARLSELCGDDATLRFDTSSDGGTRVTLDLPYHTGTDLYTSNTHTAPAVPPD